MKKILFLNDWGTNPNERVIYIADYFLSLEYKVCSVGRSTSEIPDRNYFHSIHPNIKNLTRPKRIYIRVKLIYYGIKFLIKNRPDYIYIRSDYLSFVFGVIIYFSKVKLIYETHGMTYKELEFSKASFFKIKLRKFLEGLIITRFSSTIITNSFGTKETLAHVYNKRNNVFVIQNGLDPEIIDQAKNNNLVNKEKPIIGFIGNWENWIRIEDILMISNETDRYDVIIVGEGKDFDRYKKEFPKIIFKGKVDRSVAMEYLHTFDICVNPWDESEIFKEKSARKTFEYLRAGKPIISSDVVGKEEFLKNDVHCLLYSPGNIKDLVNKIDTLITDRDLYNRMSRANKILSEDYVWDNIIKNSGMVDYINEH